MKFTIERADREDVYRDVIRIPEKYRQGIDGKIIPEGSVCKITLPTGKKVFAIIRGMRDAGVPVEKPIAKMDERLRNRLGLQVGDRVELRLKKVGTIGEFRWAWSASDPAYRAMARMALLSLTLAVLSVILAIKGVL